MIPTRPFGRTGHESTRVIFGAAAFSGATQDVADRTMEQILEWGINHIDTAASYGDAEIRLGPWMPEYRDRFFLATKTGERKAGPAYDEIQRSLERLQTDQVDLIQLHNLVEEDEWETAMGPGGALEAAIRARDEGLVRFIGVTGHGVPIARMHLRSLERFDFDAVLLPYSYMLMQNPEYATDFDELTRCALSETWRCRRSKGSRARRGASGRKTTTTWYKPLEDQESIDLAVHWVLGNEQVFLNTASDVNLAAEGRSMRPSGSAAASRCGDGRPGAGPGDGTALRLGAPSVIAQGTVPLLRPEQVDGLRGGDIASPKPSTPCVRSSSAPERSTRVGGAVSLACGKRGVADAVVIPVVVLAGQAHAFGPAITTAKRAAWNLADIGQSPEAPRVAPPISAQSSMKRLTLVNSDGSWSSSACGTHSSSPSPT